VGGVSGVEGVRGAGDLMGDGASRLKFIAQRGEEKETLLLGKARRKKKKMKKKTVFLRIF
jgi:hypothetical protein